MWPLALLVAMDFTPPETEVRFGQPHLAAGNGIVALTFGAGRPGRAVYFSASRDQGRTFSTPVVVGVGARIAIGGHRGPRIAVADSGIVIAAAVGKGPIDKDLIAWRSVDGGSSWSQGIRLNGIRQTAGEGYHGLAAQGNLVFAVWLDVRRRATRVFGARSADGGATWSADQLIYDSPDGHVCECCHPSVHIAPDGRILVMWRNWLDGARDMYLATSTDGGNTFRAEKLGRGSWPLHACPQDGGGVVQGDGGQPVTVWRRDKMVFLARPGEPEQEIGRGTDPAIVIGARGKLYVAWRSPDGLVVKVDEGAPRMLDPDGRFPAMTTIGSDVVAAWENGNKTVVRRIP